MSHAIEESIEIRAAPERVFDFVQDPAQRAKAIVQAVTHYKDAKKLAELSRGLKEAMPGLDISKLPEGELLQTRGW